MTDKDKGRLNKDKTESPSTPGSVLRDHFGLKVSLPNTLTAFIKKIVITIIYINGFALGWLTGYIFFTTIACLGTIGAQAISLDITREILSLPNSIFTVATDSCNTSGTALVSVHLFTLFTALLTIGLVWYTHYVIKHSKHPIGFIN